MSRTRSRLVRLAARAPLVLGVAGGLLVPWAVLLGAMLPRTHTADAWPLVWVGFDVLLAAGCAGTALLQHRRSPRTPVAAAATAALAIADAWFDITTANPGGDLALAVGCAVLAELPLAVYCGYLALRTPAPVTAPDIERIESPAP